MELSAISISVKCQKALEAIDNGDMTIMDKIINVGRRKGRRTPAELLKEVESEISDGNKRIVFANSSKKRKKFIENIKFDKRKN